MHTTTDTAQPGGFRATLRRGEAWLDGKGKWAWIAVMILGFVFFWPEPHAARHGGGTAMILGFVFFWPVGLALLAYMIWGKHMFARSCGQRRAHDHQWGRHAFRAGQSTGNSAFDNYKTEALRRLEDEQAAFETFLQRLRNSKDKTEFDAFMEDRARATAAQDAAEAEVPPKPETGARPGEY